ncbi:MAG: hypothetical protein ACLUHA_11710 [Bacteroides stercoris]
MQNLWSVTAIKTISSGHPLNFFMVMWRTVFKTQEDVDNAAEQDGSGIGDASATVT